MTDPAAYDTQQWTRLRDAFARAIESGDSAAVQREIAIDDPALGAMLGELLAMERDPRLDTGRAHRQAMTDASRLLDAHAIGDRVGPYVLREVIGRGGMGVVYCAERVDGRVAKKVAIKFILGSRMNADAFRRFQFERQVVATLQHPGIARLVDAGETDDGVPYYVMDLVEGEPLLAWCERNALGLRERLALFLRVCAAVAHAHANLVLHRDIKSGNVLVGADGAPVLIDFGIARSLDASADSSTLTADRVLTPGNAAPEQVDGRSLGVACDVYQLGALLFEMLVAEPVFVARPGGPNLVDRVRFEEPRRPSDAARHRLLATDGGAVRPGLVRAADLAGDLDAIVLRALRKEPAERHPSVQALVDDVEAYLAGLPVPSARGGSYYRLRRFVRRHRAAIAVAGVLVIGATAFGVERFRYLGQAEQARAARLVEQARAESATRVMVDVFEAADPYEPLSGESTVRQVLDNARRKLAIGGESAPEVSIAPALAMARVYLVLEENATAVEIIESACRERGAPASVDWHRRACEILRARADLAENRNAQARERLAATIASDSAAGVPFEQAFEPRMLEITARGKSETEGDLLPVVERLVADAEAARGRSSSEWVESTATLVDYLDGVATPESLARAGALGDELLKAVSSLYPQDHPYAAAVFAQVGAVQEHAGRHEQGVELLARALGIYERTLGPQSTRVGSTMVRIGNAYANWGRPDEALDYYQRAHRTLKARHPEPYPGVAVAAYSVATMYLNARKDPGSAIPWCREAVEVATGVYGADHPNTLAFRTQYGRALAESGRSDEALPVLEAAIGRAGVRIRDAEAAVALARILTARGRAGEAETLLAQLRDIVDREPEGERKAGARALLDAYAQTSGHDRSASRGP